LKERINMGLTKIRWKKSEKLKERYMRVIKELKQEIANCKLNKDSDSKCMGTKKIMKAF
jgi:hypothetical protein